MKSNVCFAAFLFIIIASFVAIDAAAQGLDQLPRRPNQETQNQPAEEGVNPETAVVEPPSDTDSPDAAPVPSVQDLVEERLSRIITRETDMSFEQTAQMLKGNAAAAKRLDAAMRILSQHKNSFEKIFARPGYAGGMEMDDFDKYLEAIGQKEANRQQTANIHQELCSNTLILLRGIKKELPEDRAKVLKYFPFATEANIEIAELCNGKNAQEIQRIVEGIQRRRNPPPTVPAKEAPKPVAPPLDKPEEWMKPIQDIVSDEKIKSTWIPNLYNYMMEYASAAKNDDLYYETRESFFKVLKSKIGDAEVRLSKIIVALPEMVRRNNFDGLKEILIDTAVLMPPNEESNMSQRYMRTYMAACYLAMGDEQTAHEYITSIMDGWYRGEKLDCSSTYAFIIDSMVGRNTKSYVDSIRNVKGVDDIIHFYRWSPYYLAHYGLHKEARDFITRTVQSESFTSYNEYPIALAFAVLGDFDQARLRRDKYPKNKHHNDQLLAYIVALEFLAGEFRGIDQVKIEDLQRAGLDVFDFCFDFGRGLGRHKTPDEIKTQWETLQSKFAKDTEKGPSDLACFMAGVATGLQERGDVPVSEFPLKLKAERDHRAAKRLYDNALYQKRVEEEFQNGEKFLQDKNFSSAAEQFAKVIEIAADINRRKNEAENALGKAQTRLENSPLKKPLSPRTRTPFYASIMIGNKDGDKALNEGRNVLNEGEKYLYEEKYELAVQSFARIEKIIGDAEQLRVDVEKIRAELFQLLGSSRNGDPRIVRDLKGAAGPNREYLRGALSKEVSYDAADYDLVIYNRDAAAVFTDAMKKEVIQGEIYRFSGDFVNAKRCFESVIKTYRSPADGTDNVTVPDVAAPESPPSASR